MTASSLPRRRLDRSSRRQVIGLLIGLAVVWLIVLFVAWFGKFKVPTPPKYLAQLRRLQSANPEEEAKADYQSGLYKLYVLERSDRQKIPGVVNPAERIQQLGVRVIPMPLGTADKGQERLQHAAFEYAFKYNVALLKLIEKQGLPATLPSTRPDTQPTRQTSARNGNIRSTSRP